MTFVSSTPPSKNSHMDISPTITPPSTPPIGTSGAGHAVTPSPKGGKEYNFLKLAVAPQPQQASAASSPIQEQHSVSLLFPSSSAKSQSEGEKLSGLPSEVPKKEEDSESGIVMLDSESTIQPEDGESGAPPQATTTTTAEPWQPMTKFKVSIKVDQEQQSSAPPKPNLQVPLQATTTTTIASQTPEPTKPPEDEGEGLPILTDEGLTDKDGTLVDSPKALSQPAAPTDTAISNAPMAKVKLSITPPNEEASQPMKRPKLSLTTGVDTVEEASQPMIRPKLSLSTVSLQEQVDTVSQKAVQHFKAADSSKEKAGLGAPPLMSAASAKQLEAQVKSQLAPPIAAVRYASDADQKFLTELHTDPKVAQLVKVFNRGANCTEVTSTGTAGKKNAGVNGSYFMTVRVPVNIKENPTIRGGDGNLYVRNENGTFSVLEEHEGHHFKLVKFIVKPKVQERGAPGGPGGTNYKGTGLRDDLILSKHGIIPGEGAAREALAYHVATSLGKQFQGDVPLVPVTTLENVHSKAFSDELAILTPDDALQKAVKAHTKEVRQSSVQECIPNSRSIASLSSETQRKALLENLPAGEVRRLALLDIKLWNTDRNLGNFLVTTQDPTVSVDDVLRGKQKSPLRLVAIDHSLVAPRDFESPPQFDWRAWPQANTPFTQEERKAIMDASWNEDKKIYDRFNLPSGSKRTLLLSHILLQESMKRNPRLTPAQVGELLCGKKIEGMGYLEAPIVEYLNPRMELLKDTGQLDNEEAVQKAFTEAVNECLDAQTKKATS